MSIAENVKAILAELPPGVELVAAAKTRTAAEILEAVEAGVRTIGENYVQEAAAVFPAIGRKARWHLIGHLQTNKARKTVEIFDLAPISSPRCREGSRRRPWTRAARRRPRPCRRGNRQ